MNAKYQNARGIVVYVPPINTQFPVKYPGLFDEIDIIIPRTFILAVGAKRNTGFFLNTPGIERAIREKQLPDATFAYVNVEIRLHPKDGTLIPTVTRENIHFTKEEYGDVLGRETVKRLIGKKVNKEVGRIISVMKQRQHQMQKRKAEAARKPTGEKSLNKLLPRTEQKGFNEKSGKRIQNKITRARRVVQVKATNIWRALAGRPRRGARKK